nr:coxsackievirus and adenovirus receptor homolog [Solea senegalensis]
MYIREVKDTDFGTYRCTVENPVSLGEYCEVILQPKPQTTGPPNMNVTTVVASVTDMGGGSRHIPQTESQTTGPPNTDATPAVASVTDMGGASRHIPQTESQTTGPPNMEATTVVASVTRSGVLGHVPMPKLNTSSKYYAARGENVTLECHFMVTPEDLDQLTIEWLFGPRYGQDDKDLLISFFGDAKYHKNGIQDRVRFSSPNPQDGDASLMLNDLALTDTGTYQCAIKAMTQIQSKKFVLKVMEKLPTPVCGLYGDVEEGKELILTCRISPDILPRKFRWERMTGNRRLPQPASFYGLQGDLYIKEVKKTDFGTYRCTVENPVSKGEYCEVILTTAVLTPIAVRERGLEPHVIALPAPNSATSVVIAVAVVTSAMVIIVIIITVVVFEYCKRNPHCELTDERPPRQEKCIADAVPKGDPEYISLYKMGRKKIITCEGDNQGIEISEEWYV